ncbi:N-(5'-phosphoribosyl)anthranilate isomerase [Geodia barretti]|uniref:phosphoribosylanthranilate isomerase n=1 Tax=Geodia barretti TaxID=519541 RepID=A0AA35RC23_GEOBA|nr:N-(5'-phosphoribosyl)anthranilate isomerase [Geodia barretti]
MIRTKICGIQRTEDAIIAAEAGADLIGLVFVHQRRRRLELLLAAEIADALRTLVPEPPQVVGLFADQPADEVIGTIKTCGLDLVQLCGQESPTYCSQVANSTGVGIIKVLHVSATENIEGNLDDAGMTGRLAPYQQGGTGQSFDWQVAAQLSHKGHEFLLAGGLTPDNVAEAVAQVQPWGVDVSTGVETEGMKDPEKIRAFINNARG